MLIEEVSRGASSLVCPSLFLTGFLFRLVEALDSLRSLVSVSHRIPSSHPCDLSTSSEPDLLSFFEILPNCADRSSVCCSTLERRRHLGRPSIRSRFLNDEDVPLLLRRQEEAGGWPSVLVVARVRLLHLSVLSNNNADL